MKADWCTLQALHFHPTLLHNGYVYPIVTLAKHGLNASTLCEFPITYQMLAKTLQLTPYELCALGFTSRQLMAIGMTGRDVLDLMTQTSGFTKGWLAKAFGFTKTQVARFNLTELEFKVYSNAKMHMQQLYATAQ